MRSNAFVLGQGLGVPVIYGSPADERTQNDTATPQPETKTCCDSEIKGAYES